MGSIQIVFLFDLSACKDFLFKPKEELNKKLLSIRLACLRLLTDFSSKSPNLKWGFKFFDSDSSKTQNMYKFGFSEMCLENFEVLENEICVRYERHVSFLQAFAESEQKSETSTNKMSKEETVTDSPVKILQFALTQILCEFQWETMDMWSPSVKKFKALTTTKRNYLFVLSDFKDNDELLFKYFGLNNSLSKSKFVNTFLPQSLRDSLLKKSDIHLVLVNTCLNQKFMGNFTSKMLPLLSQSMQAVQGSLVPLLILSQPLYNMKFLNSAQEIVCDNKASVTNLYSSCRNSVIPFSYLFEQSLNQPFYSTINSFIYECCISFTSEDLQLTIQVMEIFKKKPNLHKGAGLLKNKCVEHRKFSWSKFVVHFAVPRNSHYAAYEVLLCLPSDNGSSGIEAGILANLNKKLCLDGVNLILECITNCGVKMLGMLTPLSHDAALISILEPSINYLMHEPDCEISAAVSVQNTIQDNYKEESIRTGIKCFLDNVEIGNSSKTTLQPFLMEYLEPWFEPTPTVSKVLAHIESKSSNNSVKMESYWHLLKQSVKSGKRLSDKLAKPHLSNGVESNSGEKTAENLADSEIQNTEEAFPDLNHEELLLAIKNMYNSAIDSVGNIVTSSQRIVNMMVNYCTKHCDTSIEDNVYSIFKENFLMTAKKISEKYEMYESQEVTQQKIKE